MGKKNKRAKRAKAKAKEGRIHRNSGGGQRSFEKPFVDTRTQEEIRIQGIRDTFSRLGEGSLKDKYRELFPKELGLDDAR